MLSRVRQFAFVFTVEAALRCMRSTWRVVRVGAPPAGTGPHLYAHWHGDELLLVPVYAGTGFAVMASRSRDGESMSRLLTRLGYFVVRGSSSRGGAGGLKGLVDAVKRGRTAGIAVDGPRGPVFKAKPGILLLAQSTGIPVTPAACAASRSWKIPGAWNQGYFPKPFAKCVVVYGEPFEVPQNATETERAALAHLLEQRLHSLKKKAGTLVGAPAALEFQTAQ